MDIRLLIVIAFMIGAVLAFIRPTRGLGLSLVMASGLSAFVVGVARAILGL